MRGKTDTEEFRKERKSLMNSMEANILYADGEEIRRVHRYGE